MSRGDTCDGKPCKNCTGTLRYRVSGKCVPCSLLRSRTWKAANPDYDRAYYANNREGVRARQSAYHENNRDTLNEKTRQWKKDNVDKIEAHSRSYYASNSETIKAAVREYQARNPDKVRAFRSTGKARRRARLTDAGTVTAEELATLLAVAEGLCFYCEKLHGDNWHHDHFVPLALGGANTVWNSVISCPTCNLRKGAKHPTEFMGAGLRYPPFWHLRPIEELTA